MDVTLNYKEYGEGIPLVLLHGNGECGDYFVNQIGYFSNYFRVIVPDTRGHGGSPRGTAPFTIKQFAEDLHEFLTYLKIEKAIILGFSDGANIAMEFALKYSEMLIGLVLNGGNSTPLGLTPSVRFPIRIWYEVNRLFRRISKRANRTYELYGLMVNEPNITKEELSGISVPTLVIAGTKDMVTEENTREIAGAIKNSRLVIIEGDHFISSKRHDDFNREVMDFLEEENLISR